MPCRRHHRSCGRSSSSVNSAFLPGFAVELSTAALDPPAGSTVRPGRRRRPGQQASGGLSWSCTAKAAPAPAASKAATCSVWESRTRPPPTGSGPGCSAAQGCSGFARLHLEPPGDPDRSRTAEALGRRPERVARAVPAPVTPGPGSSTASPLRLRRSGPPEQPGPPAAPVPFRTAPVRPGAIIAYWEHRRQAPATEVLGLADQHGLRHPPANAPSRPTMSNLDAADPSRGRSARPDERTRRSSDRNETQVRRDIRQVTARSGRRSAPVLPGPGTERPHPVSILARTSDVQQPAEHPPIHVEVSAGGLLAERFANIDPLART